MNLFRDVIKGGVREEGPIELQHRYASLLKSYDELTEEHHQLVASQAQDAKELSALREADSVSQDRIAALDRELQACKDDLFRVQPMSQVPDSTIAQSFASLDDRICDWTETQISRFMDKWQDKHHGDQPKLFGHGADPTTKRFLARYPDTGGEYMVRSIIHCYLQKYLFGHKLLLFGLGDNLVGWLKSVEQSMSRLQPQRGELKRHCDWSERQLTQKVPEAATIRVWRSETLTSITESHEFSAKTKSEGCKLATGIHGQLCNIFPIISGSSVSLETLYNKVVKPAVDLAITTQTSTTSYEFEPRMSIYSMFERHSIPQTQLGRCRMIDAATGKTLKPDSPVISDAHGDIGNRIMVLAPGLYRHDRDKVVPLSPEIILVELYNPLGRRRGGTVEPKS